MQRLAKELKARGHQPRRALLTHQLQLAKSAADARDQHGLYSVIRRLAPKSSRQVVRIRDSNGGMLNVEHEFCEIQGYFSELFQSSSPHFAYVRIDLWSFKMCGRPCGPPELGRLCRQPQLQPFRACEGQILQPLAELMSECYQGKSPVPPHWLPCHLALLPKPNKSTRRPENLRPLGIQDPAAKIYSRALRSALYEEVKDTVLKFPQFSYLANRSTEDAIHRVMEHCRAVRCRRERAVRTVYSKKAGVKRPKIGGGAQLTLDMSTAFDRVPRSSLTEALLWAGASMQTVQGVLDLHEQCKYVIRHGPHTSYLSMKRGVKQGCTLAPLLWVVYSVYVAHHIGLETDYQWMLSHLTMYADDTHACWDLASSADLRFMSLCVRRIYEVYARFGMKLNPQKSVFVASSEYRAGNGYGKGAAAIRCLAV